MVVPLTRIYHFSKIKYISSLTKFYNAMDTLHKPNRYFQSWGHDYVPAIRNTLELVQKRSVNNFDKKLLEYF